MFWGANVTLDEKSVNKVLKKEGARADEALRACRDILAETKTAPGNVEGLQQACRDLCEPMEIKPKNMFQPLRVAVCGNMVSPPLFESIELMERADVLARIDATMNEVFASRPQNHRAPRVSTCGAPSYEQAKPHRKQTTGAPQWTS